ncbi:siderophore ABC transporter substrate-binding protein [Inconstantimicrobium porci]|uniref:siderophore ABC transporter substrate-binding protein n=1 Tax=Inconstantimicrobium porci TaxID=2652291 RepID=UPI002409A6F5|nr:siderophore ABC transporter substrate-binding protein [Inconstantimicrobium porci]MDD6772323.1 siderophore ABC transporter substrate-binding protein [Inconstantimicrobium porci]
MKKKMTITIAILLIIAAGVFGVKYLNKDTDKSSDNVITIAHKYGETKVNKNPSNIAVFDYGALDSLEVLGIEASGLPKQSIPSSLSKYKDDKYKDLGGLKEPDFEKLSALKPDLIIISGRQANLYDEFSKIAPTLYVEIDNNDQITSIIKNLRMYADIFDKKDVAEKEIEDIEKSIEELKLKAIATEKNGLIALANSNSFSVYGKGSRFGIIHQSFGIPAVDSNIEDSTHGQKASFEYIVEKDPDYLFVIDRAAVVGGDVSADKLFENELMKKTKAYQNNNIVYLNAENWYTVMGGVTSLKSMITEINNCL